MVVRGDLAIGKPTFVCREDRRDESPSGPDDLGVATDGVGTIHQVKDGIDAIGMIGMERIDHVNGQAVVDLLGAIRMLPCWRRRGQSRWMRAPGVGHLHRVAANAARRAHHHDVLAPR